jgi:hypothetical protein
LDIRLKNKDINYEYILYGTLGCHLCEQAKTMLEQVLAYLESRGITAIMVEVDIADSDELMQQYGLRIPVLKNQVKDEELGWPFEPEDVLAFILER